jgi:macrodomain Ter protein organizer (MatP/YcbG family)
MDAEKWKSVVISIAAYKKLKELAKRNHRTISGQFTHLLEQALGEKL